MVLAKYRLGDIATVAISGIDKKTVEGEIPVSLCNFVDVYYNWAITKDHYPLLMNATARQSEIDELERVLHAKLSIDEEMLSSYICRRFHYYANHPLDNFSSQEMDMLIEMVEQKIPSFYITLHSGKSITQFDYFVCVLIRLQFAQVEISSLTGIASPNLTRKRRQLLTRCFGIQGSAEEFNEIITAIK